MSNYPSSVLVSSLKFGGDTTDEMLVDPYSVIVRGKYIWASSVKNSAVMVYKLCKNNEVKSCRTIPIPSPTGMCFGAKNTIYVASNTGSIYKMSECDTEATLYFKIDRSPTSVGGIAYCKGMLYVAVFSFGYVQVYNVKSNCNTKSHSNATSSSTDPPKEVSGLTDESLSEFRYVPIAVACICNNVYITYGDGSIVPGFGYVNVFNIKSHELSRLINRGILAYPYGIASHNDKLYVANGSGYIGVYSMTGEYEGTLSDFYSDGLRSIFIDSDKLYYVAANNNGSMGSLGVVELR